jgi:uncharacterized membrane protein (DUF4010 family)
MPGQSAAQLAGWPILVRLGVALAIGLLIGLERGWERRDLPEGHRAAGFRTFGVIGLTGGIAVQLGSVLTIPALAIAVGAIAALGYWRESAIADDISVTTAAASVLTLCLGALAGSGAIAPAAAAAVVMTLVLGFKPELHGIIRHIEREELLATLRLLLISVVLLPVIPNRGMGPWHAFNPYRTWWLVVLVASISYIGYFAIKLLGAQRGVLVTGLFGGMVSSTAVTLNLSRHARDEGGAKSHGDTGRGAESNGSDGLPDLLAAGIAIATAMMFPRLLIIVGAVAIELVEPLLWPSVAAAIAAVAVALWLVRDGVGRGLPAGHEHTDPGNPLDLWSAVRFALILAVIGVMAQGARVWLGNDGLYVLAAISGLVDAAPVSLSVATMVVAGQTPIMVAVRVILIAAAVNTALKPILATITGGARIGWRVLAVVACAIGAGAIGFVVRG